ncbi:MAG: lysylphosphatidylglycerol synthase domain-containing protein [Gammaproteobacteria bacterium]
MAALRALALCGGITVLAVWAYGANPARSADAWSWSLPAGVLLSTLSIVLFALRLRGVLQLADVRLDLVTLLRLQLLALFWHFFVPLSAGADMTRFAVLRRLAPGRSRGALAGAIVLDHFVGLATLLLMASALGMVLEPLVVAPNALIAVIGVIGTLVAAGILVVRWQRGRAFTWRSVAARLLGGRRALIAALAWSMAMQAVLAAAVWCGSAALGVEISYPDVLFVLTAALVLQAVPASIGGVGAAELAGTGLYVAIGVPLPDAVLLVSLLYFYRLTMAIAGGLWEMTATRGLMPAGQVANQAS